MELRPRGRARPFDRTRRRTAALAHLASLVQALECRADPLADPLVVRRAKRVFERLAEQLKACDITALSLDCVRVEQPIERLKPRPPSGRSTGSSFMPRLIVATRPDRDAVLAVCAWIGDYGSA